MQKLPLNALPTGSFSYSAALTTLWLNNNNLATVQEAIFDPSNRPTNLNGFYVYSNPLECDQRLRWLHEADGDWLTVAYSGTTICSGPAGLAGRAWNTLTDDDLDCPGL